MAVVYRYVDLHDEVIKYVGIVWSENRTLKQRVKEHSEQDDWCIGGCWRVEYLQKEVKSRIDAELLEAHYISKFKTNEWYNVSKANWGTSELLQDDSDEEWKEYETIGNIKPSDMIETFEEGFVYMKWSQENHLLLCFDDKNEEYGVNMDISPKGIYLLEENADIFIRAIDVFYACLSQLKSDELENEISQDTIYKNMINGKKYHFFSPCKIEHSEISGNIIRLQVGQVIISNSGNIPFNSVKDILNSPNDYSVITDEMDREYDDFQLSDLEKKLGLTSTDQNESAERK